MSFILRYAFILLLIPFWMSCSITKMASDITSGMMVGGSPIAEQEEDVKMAEDSGLALLKTLEVFSYQNPNNKNYKLLLARNYANYTFGILENKLYQYEGVDQARYDENLKRAKLFYRRGRDYGLSVLKEDKDFAEAIEKGTTDQLDKALRSISGSKQPILFWTAFAWGGLINWSKDDPMAIVELGKVERMMARAAELNNTYFYGAPHMFYGVYYGSRPAMLGGNNEKSKQNFEEAIKINGGRLFFTKVLYAQFYAVQAQDRALFNSLLNEVISADPNVLPEQRLGNILAQERAKLLLSKESTLFGS